MFYSNVEVISKGLNDSHIQQEANKITKLK